MTLLILAGSDHDYMHSVDFDVSHDEVTLHDVIDECDQRAVRTTLTYSRPDAERVANAMLAQCAMISDDRQLSLWRV